MSDEVASFAELFAVPLRNGVSYPSGARGEGVPMINMREMFAFDRIGDEKCERVPLTESERANSLLQDNDLLFARQSLTYEGAGKCSLVLPAKEPRTWDSHLMRVRLDNDVADPRFYFYYFRSPAGRRNMETIVQQVAAAGIRGSDLGRLLVPTPPLATQRRIAEVLGALDDKIVTNGQQLGLVAQLADAIFTLTAAKYPSKTLTFADVADVGGGGTPRTSVGEYWNGDRPWATPTDVTALEAPYLDLTTRKITDAGLAACASALYPAGSILMTSRATIGAFAIAQVPMAVNQGFIVVNAKEADRQWWLFHDMRSRVDEFLAFANGATFLELPRGRFKSLPVCIPSDEVLQKFNERVAPLHALAAALGRENRKLAATRDELLPLLMSGKIRVRDAERQVEDAL